MQFVGQQYKQPAQEFYLGNNGTFQNRMPLPIQQIDSSPTFKYLGTNNGFSHANSYNAMQMGFSTPEMQAAALENFGLQNDYLKLQMNQIQNPSWQQQYLAPVMQGIQGLSSLGGMYLGFQNLKLQKKQVGLAQEQWATTKKEMERIAGVRKNLNASYNS